MTLGNDILEVIRFWHDQDPDSDTKEELSLLLERSESGDEEASALLEQWFAGRLTFGTAGIRGPVRPGPAGMNRVVVSQTTAGLGSYLLESRSSSDFTILKVVVGCDARTKSDVFLQDTLEVLSGFGIETIALPTQLPTPVLAFAVRQLNADAGVMITASHNPPADNGYKVYFGGEDQGSQIVSPSDRNIEEHIQRIVSENDFQAIPRSEEHILVAPASIVQDYIHHTKEALNLSGAMSELKVVYTPLHGVGAGTFLDAARECGFSGIHVVSEQEKPDASFPTVAFPNPEEKGALDLSFELGRKVGADLVLANDPDADRLAVALRDPSSSAGFAALTGNQVGAILGWWAATKAKKSGFTGALANSLVSSPVLGRIASHFGLDHEETLTGFKYVSRVPNLLFGFEEALGYLVTPSVLRDKDGISAGLAILDLAHQLASEGQTLWDYLADIEEAVGGFASSQITIRLSSDSTRPSMSDALRQSPPIAFGSKSVSRVDDFIKGFEAFPPENIIRYYLEDGSRVIVRPSGTEPKLKIYLDTSGPTRLDAEESLHELERDVRGLIDSLGH